MVVKRDREDWGLVERMERRNHFYVDKTWELCWWKQWWGQTYRGMKPKSLKFYNSVNQSNPKKQTQLEITTQWHILDIHSPYLLAQPMRGYGETVWARLKNNLRQTSPSPTRQTCPSSQVSLLFPEDICLVPGVWVIVLQRREKAKSTPTLIKILGLLSSHWFPVMKTHSCYRS